MSENEFKDLLKKWIAERSKDPESIRTLANDTRVIESGLLSSLDIVELVLYIESIRGQEIDVEDLEPEAFSTVDAMYDKFFGLI